VVLNDLGSSAFYAGDCEEAVVSLLRGSSGRYAVLFRGARGLVESCSMFTRGGVYRVVKELLGGTFAKTERFRAHVRLHPYRTDLGVSAGQYITSLLNELMRVGGGA